jgi:phosphoribosylanthranilate isomerase
VAARAGADFLGLVGAMPSGPGPIPDALVREIARSVPGEVTPVLLTSRETAGDIADHVRETCVRAVQVVRPVPASVRRALRGAIPGLIVFQVVHVEGPDSMGSAMEGARESDFLLLDSGRPNATVPELGGTGRVHDWSVSAEIVAASPVPVFLAGGLDAENVAGAVSTVAPFGVDVCSGLRGAAGRLDVGRLEAFVAALGQGGAGTPAP